MKPILRSFGCRASAQEPRPIQGDRVEGATGSCPEDFPAAEDARKAKERQRTVKTEKQSNGTGKVQMKTMKYILMFAATIMVILLAASRAVAETVIWSESFDDGLGDNRWAADGTGAWHIGSPTEGSPTNSLGSRAFSGTNCAGVGLTAPYIINQDSRLYSLPTADIPAIPAANQNPRLRFWHWYSIGGGNHATVEIMPAGSNTGPPFLQLWRRG